VRRVIGDNGEQQRLIRTIIGKGARFVGLVREARRLAEISTSLLTLDLALPDKPSIAVLPFANLSPKIFACRTSHGALKHPQSLHEYPRSEAGRGCHTRGMALVTLGHLLNREID
jgi:hypothetical protein